MEFKTVAELQEYLQAQEDKIATLEKMISERQEPKKEDDPKDPETTKEGEKSADESTEEELTELEKFLDSY